MFCRNVTLTLHEWRKENYYQRVFSDDAPGTLNNRLNSIPSELFSERQKTGGRPVLSTRFEHI